MMSGELKLNFLEIKGQLFPLKVLYFVNLAQGILRIP